MSDQRKFRSELRQGLYQFLMSMYMSYCESNTEQDAKLLMLEVLDEMYQHFDPDGRASTNAHDVIQERIKELTKKMNETDDYDTQLYYAERIDSLSAAIEALKLVIS